MRTYFVVNPQSGNGQTGRKWPEISARLRSALGDFGHGFTSQPMHAAELARRSLFDGYECVVAVGGDGTLNEVVNGFFDSGKPINSKAAVGLIPRGTGGDFRRTFGWNLELSGAIERLSGDRSAPFDVGLLEFTGHDGSSCHRYFANICSFGVSGQVDAEVNRSSKALGGKVSFMLGSVKALLKYSDRSVKVSTDGAAPERLSVTTLAVANGRYFGGGMMVAPEADTSDGLFDVTIWSGYSLSDFVFKSKAIYDGGHVRFPGTRTLRCKRLSAQSEQEVLIDIDGEQPGRLPCAMTILPSAIRLRV
ncbi:MAG: diacylglycerol kinase family lipid kinase [Myxococcales bacterium]|nr:diacylglycerol kinase family lipid kinase [Myxococcales bacterium]